MTLRAPLRGPVPGPVSSQVHDGAVASTLNPGARDHPAAGFRSTTMKGVENVSAKLSPNGPRRPDLFP